MNLNNVNTEEFRKNKYYKIVNAVMGSDLVNIHYEPGLNVFNYREGQSISKGDGIYFTDIKNIFNYISYGPIILELTIPSDSIVVYSPENMKIDSDLIPGWCADKVFVNNAYSLINVNHIRALIELGADIRADDCNLLKWALFNNLDIFKFIIDYYNQEDFIKIIRQYYMLDI